MKLGCTKSNKMENLCWINRELFINCLKNEYQLKPFDVKILSIIPATTAGDNYASKIYRINVQISDDDSSINKYFIIKHILNLDENMLVFKWFPKECIVYSNNLPALSNEYNNATDENIQFGPTFYLSLNDSVEALIFEDLNARGYFMKDRFLGLDMEHCKVFLNKLAKFHATSATYHEKNGDYCKKYFNCMFYEEYMNPIKNYGDGLFPYLLETVKKNTNLNHLVHKVVSR